MKKRYFTLIKIICLLLIINAFSFKSQAKENIIPNYEVKFLLDSDCVLNSDHLLKKEYRNTFSTGKDYKTIGVLYMDTEDRDFDIQGWTNRIRTEDDSKDFELTYKKRYPITDGDIVSALNLANDEGFDIGDTNYKAQVDWGYSKMILSLSCKKKASDKGYDNLELPKKSDARKILEKDMPGKENRWLYENWGSDMIEDGEKVGPVYYNKYSGIYCGKHIVIEIWPIEDQVTNATEYITEASFKTDTYEEADMFRNTINDALDQEGILIHEDSLKTQKMVDAYLAQ